MKVARHAARRGAPDAPRRHAVLVLEFFDAWAVLISCEARALTEGSNQPNRYSIGFKSWESPNPYRPNATELATRESFLRLQTIERAVTLSLLIRHEASLLKCC